MKTIKAKSWICNCGYSSQVDHFDPEALRVHFHEDLSPEYAASRKKAGYEKLLVGQCPKCGNASGMRAATPSDALTVLNILELSDMPLKRQELENDGPKKVSTGFKEIRQETEDEKAHRIGIAVQRQPEHLKVAIKADLEKSPLLTREFDVLRDELPEEMAQRIDQELARLKPATPEEVQALCEKYECK